MKIKDFFNDFEVNPISSNPLHGPATQDLMKYLQERNETRRQQAIASLGTRWLVHPSNQVQRKEAA